MLPIEPLLSRDGWAYASMPPVDGADPGRFHALFGRDSLIFALQVLPERPAVARDTLRTLARFQGRISDPEIDEEPGKIIHEYRPVAPARLVAAGWPTRRGGIRYYGTADATSWFIVLLAATGDQALAAELFGAWRSAAAWLERALKKGDGLVRYGPRTQPGGLSQQGWRNSRAPEQDPDGGGILRADRTTPTGPLADADCQAAAMAALRALVTLDPERARHWRRRAATLRARLSSVFGPDVMALEATGAVVPGAGSQLGRLLWADALDSRAAKLVADRLTQADVLTEFGLRTLSSEHPAFRADSYHRGSVWPSDSWLGWGGLRAHGQLDAADHVRSGVLTALDRLGPAPELFAVSTAGKLESVAVANRVQAATVGAQRALRSGWDGRPQ